MNKLIYEKTKGGYKITGAKLTNSVLIIPARYRFRKVVAIDRLKIDGKLTTVKLPDTVIDVKDFAFSGQKDLEMVFAGRNLIAIGKSAFQECEKLEKIEVGSRLAVVGEHAFDGCISLGGIELPECTSMIGAAAFRGCKSLKSFSNPSANKLIEPLTFENSGLEEFYSNNVDVADNAFKNTKLDERSE